MNDISVVMGTFNGASHLDEQLRSVVRQSLPPAEILIGDDGSDDGTLDLVERFAGGCSVPIRVHRNAARLGFADNFLATAARASSRFVAFCDQDDRWHPRKLERSRDALLAERALLCVHPVQLMTSTGDPLAVDSQEAEPGVLEARSLPPWRNFFGFTMTFERSLLDVVPADRRGPDIHTPGAPLPHDRWVSFLALNLGRTVVLPEVLADYRQHERQLYGSGAGTASALARRVDWGRRALARVGTSSERLGFLGDVAGGLAAALDGAAPTPLGDIQLAAARWHHLTDAYHRRARLHGVRSPLRSARVITEGVRSGDYATAMFGGLGRSAFIEDASLGLLGGLVPSTGAAW